MSEKQYVEGMYSTGEVARLCGITVRTVQYYDERGLVVPSAETDGGRRLYADADLRRELKAAGDITLESIGDIAHVMSAKEELKRMRRNMILAAIPVAILEIAGIVMWIVAGWWWLFVAYVVVAIPWGIWFSKYYASHVAYICPECHEVFKPTFKEMFWANHTPATRKLHCPACGHHGFCVETAASMVTYPAPASADAAVAN